MLIELMLFCQIMAYTYYILDGGAPARIVARFQLLQALLDNHVLVVESMSAMAGNDLLSRYLGACLPIFILLVCCSHLLLSFDVYSSLFILKSLQNW